MDRGNQGQKWRGTTQTAINCDTFWLQTLGRHEIVLWQIQKFICYCTVFALFYFVFEGTFQVQAPRGLYSEGRFNGGFFALRVWGAYIWRGLYMEGLIFGILRYRLSDPRGYYRFQETGTIEGFYWVWNFRFRDFFGWLDLSRDFWGYSKQTEDSW